jgi:hypothetical protein
MAVDIKAELLRFLVEHVKLHGADWRSESYINANCDLWAPKYGKTAEAVRAEAMKFHSQKEGTK